MKKIIAANWKNSQTINKHFIKSYFEYLYKNLNSNHEIVVFPPDIYIDQVNNIVKKFKNIKVGGQGLSYWRSQYQISQTGGTTAKMFQDNECKFILCGHSEMRYHENTTQSYYSQIEHIESCDSMQPILCIGENQGDKENGNVSKALLHQLKDATFKNSERVIIGYEPIWAIGSGSTPDIIDINSIHEFIRSTLSSKEKDIMIIYGGSVNSKNAKEILTAKNVDGLLIGGASLDAEEFTKICNLEI